MQHRIPDGLNLIRKLDWSEVFDIWRANEAHRDGWKAHYKERGFASWEEWRMSAATAFGLPELSWSLYEISSPSKIIPAFHGGPFRSWSERFYGGSVMPSFAELISNPELRKHGGVLAMIENFPENTVITGVLTDDGVVIAEGMHRCCAVTLAAESGRDIARGMRIALADYGSRRMPATVGTAPKP
ncbi:MAG: hypothetical protein AAB692_02235 [Patescibacteria group bacterium]